MCRLLKEKLAACEAPRLEWSHMMWTTCMRACVSACLHACMSACAFEVLRYPVFGAFYTSFLGSLNWRHLNMPLNMAGFSFSSKTRRERACVLDVPRGELSRMILEKGIHRTPSPFVGWAVPYVRNPINATAAR